MNTYFDTIWPTEHADSERHQFILGNGLQISMGTSLITTCNSGLDCPNFALTRAPGELFAVGGSPNFRRSTGWIARLNSETLAVAKHVPLQDGVRTWAASCAMHCNGYVYAATGHYLYKLDAELNLLKKILLPDGFEGESSILILSSGDLLVKGGKRLLNTRSTLLLVTPDLSILDKVTLPEIFLGRPSVHTFEGQEYAYCIGATTVWRIICNTTLRRDLSWSFPYMQHLVDSTPGNAPTFVENDLFFMSNTLQGATDPLSIFRVGVDNSNDYSILQPFPESESGFSLSKMAADPVHRIIFPMDTANRRLCAVSIVNREFEPLWSQDYGVSNIFAGSVADEEIYINDFDGGGDNFVTLNILSGDELARVELPGFTPTYTGFSVGFANQVYTCCQNAIFRFRRMEDGV